MERAGFLPLPPPGSQLLTPWTLVHALVLTLNSWGTISFGVARPKRASRPQPSRMARTEEKSPRTLRTCPRWTLTQVPVSSYPSPNPGGFSPALSLNKAVALTMDGKKRLDLMCWSAMAERKTDRKRSREKKAMSGAV